MVMRRPVRRTLPDLIDWAENLPEAFTWANWPTSSGVRGIRVEEFVQDGRYVVRAELPGLDPEGIRVEVEGDVMVIHAERQEEKHERGRTEFQYGVFERRVALPEGADQSGITARYDAGVLEVTVPVREVRTEARSIPVQRSGTLEGSAQATRTDETGATRAGEGVGAQQDMGSQGDMASREDVGAQQDMGTQGGMGTQGDMGTVEEGEIDQPR